MPRKDALVWDGSEWGIRYSYGGDVWIEERPISGKFLGCLITTRVPRGGGSPVEVRVFCGEERKGGVPWTLLRSVSLRRHAVIAAHLRDASDLVAERRTPSA